MKSYCLCSCLVALSFRLSLPKFCMHWHMQKLNCLSAALSVHATCREYMGMLTRLKEQCLKLTVPEALWHVLSSSGYLDWQQV